MSSLLQGVTTVISSFTSWFSSLTSTVISNDIVKIIFALYLVYKIDILILRWILRP